MFDNESLSNHFKTSRTIRSESFIISEWNMNFFDNIDRIGNYRYRPLDGVSSIYGSLPTAYDPSDSGNFYTGATDSDATVDGGYENSLDVENAIPKIFLSKKEKTKYLFSLEDCFGRFRPRSGINKAIFGLNSKYLHFSNPELFSRPRYYMPDIDDKFKYWSSYRTEVVEPSPGQSSLVERGVSYQNQNGVYFIDDASPFVVYKEPVPANRVVVKMQTHSTETNLGPFANSSSVTSDPFFGIENRVVPVRWRIQVLKNSQWVDAVIFDENSVRSDGTPVVGYDGYVEIFYANGAWSLLSSDINEQSFATKLSSPIIFSQNQGKTVYSEIDFVGGIRVAVETMNTIDSTFDLIELSPRLAVDISEVSLSYSVSKTASDLGQSGLPVGQLIASSGNIEIFDYDEWFNPNNINSIIANFSIKNMQIKFFEKIIGVDGSDYFVPIKTMYAEGFPTTTPATRSVSISLRDLYFHFESITAPQIFIPNVSLSYAIALLLDSVGFSNYVYRRLPGESDPVIPYFYVSPDQSVAEVLQLLAVSTQSAMFFDEYNNFVVMSKDYFMPSSNERSTDIVLQGTDSSSELANIIEVSDQENNVYNDGYISYNNKYIQRTYGSLKQAYYLDKQKSWVYKPSLLWEVSGTENTKSINEESSTQSGYSLSAIPLNSDLSDDVPEVVNGVVINNILDLGEAIYWLSRYNGYFYANGEIIKYDAAEFSIPGVGNVWISSNREYQDYFSKLKFNGKIYPTGRVRIFSEPRYETVSGVTRLQSGSVLRHGRGQFGTKVISHTSGIGSDWISDEYVKSVKMESGYLFANREDFPELSVGIAGVDLISPKLTSRSGVIKNFMNLQYLTQDDSQQPVQASALNFSGPGKSDNSLVSYVYKPLGEKFKYFGTRLRVVGRIENKTSGSQNPSGSVPMFSGVPISPDEDVVIQGGGGGLSLLLNPETNNGYYFEVTALSEKELERYDNAEELFNVFFYKIVSGPDSKAIPVKLWSGKAEINVDDGTMIGQSRIASTQGETVYDLAVQYEDLNGIRRFYLYLNDTQIATVDDMTPMPVFNNMALFVRGSSNCMFENVFALGNNYANNSSFEINLITDNVFSESALTSDSSLRKYALSGIVQASALSGISRFEDPKYNIYYDEFGTIMREAAYFKARYDKAFPALSAKLFPTFNKVKGYSVSGFRAGAYEAEFLVFNATDSALVLDETTGNYLRIQGITFTQDSTQQLSVDQYFEKIGSLSDPVQYSDGTILSPEKQRERYETIRVSRSNYGVNEFSLDAEYIQSEDAARNMMQWLVDKVMRPRRSIGIEVFPTPTIQLSDIVQINYQNSSGSDAVVPSSNRFVVYNIEYDRSENGPTMKIYLTEV